MDVKTVCLAVLTIESKSGYQIKKMFEAKPFSDVFSVSYGSIYPSLSFLEKRKFVTSKQMVQSNRPAKKVYSITKLGKESLIRQLNKHPSPDKVRSEFLITILFSNLLTDDFVLDVVEKRIKEYKKILQTFKQIPIIEGASAIHFISGLGESVYTTAVNYMEKNKHILKKNKK